MTTAVDPVVAEAGRRTPRHHFWHGLRVVILRRPSRVAGALICALFAFLAVFGPYLYPANLPIDPTAIFQGPSAAHWLGTDFEGTDVLALLITGTRYVLEAAAFASLFTVVIGTTVGLVAGYHRGLSDSTLMKVTDFVLTIPGFPLLIVLSTVWDFGAPWSMGLVLGVTGWGGLARAVRSQTLSLRERGFIEAARGLDLSALHIVFRELLPNVAPYIAMSLLLTFTGFVYAEVGLFFLGVVPFTVNNWGVMLNLAIQNGALSSTSALSYLLAPLVAILLLTLGVVLVLDAFDELFNPRLREG
jgi:peptide/nickel transport system permease protein